jgi:hypothetical protein
MPVKKHETRRIAKAVKVCCRAPRCR